MHRALRVLPGLLALACATVASAQAPPKPAGYKVTVTVHGVASDAGTIRGQLCTDRDAFGVRTCGTFVAVTTAKPGSVELVFNNVTPGAYAFSVFHDENGDERTQVFSEPFAFGNEARSLPPIFDEAILNVSGDMTSSTTLFRMTG
jgi:uncharacterized protein (DUF2141 family)